MNEQKLSAIVHAATGIALVLGLGLVMIELRQSKELALAEITSQGYSEVIENARTTMGENPAISISKACNSPNELTPEDDVVLNAFYRAQVTQIDRLRVLEAVANFGVPWRQFAPQLLTDLLSQEHGRRWFDKNLYDAPELVEIRDEILATNPSCQSDHAPFNN